MNVLNGQVYRYKGAEVPFGRPTALVTGASSGIGRSFAALLAGRGFNLVLTARRAERLRTLAAALHTKHGIEADVVVADLGDTMAPASLMAYIEWRGLHIEMLVNNAGYSVPGAYTASAWQEHRKFIRVLVTAPCELVHLVLPMMIERRRGYIVNVASVEGLKPGSAHNTLYAAAKAFMIQFSRSLHAEVVRNGINVTALCPGYTHTEFHDVRGMRKWAINIPPFMWMTADEVALQGYNAVLRNKILHVPGTFNKGLVALAKYTPDNLASVIKRAQSRVFRMLSTRSA